jgi:hypothetical protein
MLSASTPDEGTTQPTAAQVAAAKAARQQQLRATYSDIRAHYTDKEILAISLLYETAKRMLDTGGGSRCAKLLLGLYNGNRFPFDLTDLRALDNQRLDAAMVVLRMDAQRTYTEVHQLLNAIYDDGRNVGAELEHWAYTLRLRGRAKKEHITADFGPKWERTQ